MTEQAVELVMKDGVAWCTLNRPRALNAIDESVLSGLAEAFAAIEKDERLKAAVVTGTGDAFCVGLDIELLGSAFDDHEYFRDFLERYKRVLLDIEASPVPVIAAVNGLARAGGFELVLACDLVLVAEDARIGDNHVAFGIMPGGGATARAPRKLGEQRARELVLTGRWMDGREAVETGLALRAVPRADLLGAAEQLAAGFRDLSRPALAATKAAMNAASGMPLQRALDAELEAFARFLAEEPSAREGYDAFVEKREPRWP